MREPSLSSSSVVMTGAFNPAIFQPSWFARNNLITNDEADSAKVGVIHGQVSQFETESFILQATTERFAVVTKTQRSLGRAPRSPCLAPSLSLSTLQSLRSD